MVKLPPDAEDRSADSVEVLAEDHRLSRHREIAARTRCRHKVASPAVTPVDRPLALGELLSETGRLYGERIWASLAIGAVVAAAFVLTVVVANAVAGTAIIALAFTAAFAAAARIASGDALAEAGSRVLALLRVLVVLAVVVSVPLALGIFDPILLLFAAFWIAFAGFAIPVVMVETPPASDGWLARIGHAMTRSLALARAQYLHAVGVVAALLLVYVLAGQILVASLAAFADNSGFTAFLIVQVVLAPFFFLGLAVLYFDQRARARVRDGGEVARPGVR